MPTTILLVLILGWSAGSLVNYLADVLPYKRRLVAPFCRNCNAAQAWIRYFLWPRTCPICGHGRGIRSWLVQLMAVGAMAWLWWSPSPVLGFFAGLIMLVYFGVVVVIDLEHRLILHPVSIAGALLGLSIGIWLRGLVPTLLGGLAGFGCMLILYYLGDFFARMVARSRGETLSEEALGFGDVNLSGVLGLILGWPGIFVGLFLGILAGGLIGLLYMGGMLLTRRYRSFVAIPYAPFLVAGAILLLYFRDFVVAVLGR